MPKTSMKGNPAVDRFQTVGLVTIGYLLAPALAVTGWAVDSPGAILAAGIAGTTAIITHTAQRLQPETTDSAGCRTDQDGEQL